MRARVITADTQVSDHKLKIWGIGLCPASGVSGSVVLYDEATADKTAAKKIAALRSPYAATETSSKEVMFPTPLLCTNGLYVDIEGTNATVFIYLE